MTENGEQNRDILLYLRERDEAREELKKLQTELSSTQSKLYDSNCKVDELKAQVKQLEQNATKSTAANTKAPAKKAPAKTQNSTAKGGSKGKLAPPQASNRNVSPSPSATSSTAYHPPIFGMEHLSNDSVQYYTEIAKRFPDLKLSLVLDAEKKFTKADSNPDGVIDKDELDKVLASDMNYGLFTPKQVLDIIKEIDQDNNETLEFVEVLAILEKLSKRRSKLTTLPNSIQENQTKICSIQ